MTIIEAEKNLALFIAGLLNAEPDRKIFSGNFPESVPDGITVDFRHGTPASFNGVHNYTACVRGRFRNRCDCRNAVDTIAARLPVFGAMELISVKFGKDPQVKFSDDDDSNCFEFEIFLDISYI